MWRNALRKGLCAFCVSVLCAAVCGVAADSERGPSIREMELAAGAAPTDVSAEVGRALDEAKARLKEGEPYAAKAVLMRLKRFTALREPDYALIAPVEKQVDEALGKDREKIEAQIAAQIAQDAEAEQHWTEFRQLQMIQEEVDRKTSKALTEQARVLLYFENEPEKAKTLAFEALGKDPENVEAAKVLLDARVQLGEQPAQRTLEGLIGISQAPVALETAKQEFAAAKRRAVQLYAQGQSQRSLEEWRRAQTYLNVLSVWMDVQKESEEIQKQLEMVGAAAEKERQAAEGLRALEAREVMETATRRIEEGQAEQEAEMLDRVYKLIRAQRYEEAEKLIKELKYQSPGNEGAQVVDEILTHEEHDSGMDEHVWRTEKERLALIRKVYEQAIPYAELMDYPDKRLWLDVIGAREGVRYPSKLEKYTPEELEVMRHLDTKVSLAFDETPLASVIEFLEEVTPVNFAIHRQDIPVDQAPITLHIETTLRNALDMICSLSGMGWKVEGSVIRIANPERLKRYELRVYDIRDLLLNTEDKVGARGGLGYGGQGYGTTGGYGYGDQGYGTTGGYGYGTTGYGTTGYGTTGYGTTGYGTTGYGTTGGYGYGGQGQGYGGQAGGAAYSENLMDRADALRLLIQQTVAPETWAEGGVVGGAAQRTGTETGLGYQQEAGIWGGAETGFGMPTTTGVTAEDLTKPRGRAFFRGGNPGDLIIIQTPEVHAEIEELLRQLRYAMYIQVNVDTRFIEVTSDFIKEIGFAVPVFDTYPGAEDEADAEGSRTQISLGTGIGQFGSTFFGETAGQGLDIAFSIFDGTAFQSLLRAVQTHRGARTLAAPSITLMNAQRGYVSVSTTESYVGEWRTTEEAFEPVIDEIAQEISLDVRPIVSADRRYVYLELAPYRTGEPTLQRFEWQTVVPSAVEGGEPAVATNYIQLPKQLSEQLEVTVCVPDRGILMIGGLTSYGRDEVERGVPILNKIPILKRLFMGEAMKINQSTLIILVRPRIILLPEEEGRAF